MHWPLPWREACQNEVEHITPGRSSSNSTIKMKQSLFLLEAHRATAQKKMKQNLLHVLWRTHSTNQEYCSCKKDCSSSHCACVLKGKKCSSLCHGGKSCKNEAECINPIWVSELSLNLDDKNAILLGDWLTDKHISAANQTT